MIELSVRHNMWFGVIFMKRFAWLRKQNSLLTVYDWILTAAISLGALLGALFAAPAFRAGHGTLAGLCAETLQASVLGFLPCLLSLLFFPLLVRLLSLLRRGALLIVALMLFRGFVFGYSFSLFAFCNAGAALLVLAVREAVLLAFLFAVVGRFPPFHSAKVPPVRRIPLFCMSCAALLYFLIPYLLEKC